MRRFIRRVTTACKLLAERIHRFGRSLASNPAAVTVTVTATVTHLGHGQRFTKNGSTEGESLLQCAWIG